MMKKSNQIVQKQIKLEDRVVKATEDNPDLPCEFIKQAIIAKFKKDTDKLESYSFG